MKNLAALALLLLCGHAFAVDHPLPAVKHGAEQNKIRVTLIDQDTPDTCPSQTVNTTNAPNLTVILSTDVSATAYDTFTIGEFDTIAAFGTWQSMDTSVPGAIPFGAVPGDPCRYEIHLPNPIFDVVGAKRIYITIHDTSAGVAGEITSDTWYIDLNTTDLAGFWDYGLTMNCEDYDTLNSVGERICNPAIDAIETYITTTLPDSLTALSASVAAVPETVWTSAIENAGPSAINARCALATVLSTLQGLWTTSGSTATFTDPSGTEERIVQTSTATSKTDVDIMCPTL